ncbi:MAG: DNA alkylation repair protein [Spirochaetales bacterium]|nr:DNA alkylation repair protein [Spirochaetales bacterium]
MIDRLKADLYKYSSEERSIATQRYFKTGKGEYGEGDIFIGISNPDLRIAIKPYINSLELSEVENLLKSREHEFRLAALLILVQQFRMKKNLQESIVNIYISNTSYINNWDLVDLSAHVILGPWLENKPRYILYDFANSGDLWKERISVLTTLHFIKKNRDFKDIFKISEILLNHQHDLIHKAVGWMLREVGKISILEEEKFLKQHYKIMPRTMLRYAIEKFPQEKRQSYLKGLV